MRSTLLLLALFGFSQCTIYWLNGQENPTNPSPVATMLVYSQVKAVKDAEAKKDIVTLHQLIDYSQFIQLRAHDFQTISFVGDCFYGPTGHIKGQVVANRSVGEVYDILMVRSDSSPTGWSIAYLLRAQH